MWWRVVPKRVLMLGSAMLLGRLAWSRWRRPARQARPASLSEEPIFPDTVPSVWSGLHEDTVR